MIATRGQGVALVVLRTLLGWHFLYEGYYKLALPAWSTTGRRTKPKNCHTSPRSRGPNTGSTIHMQ